MVYSFPSLEKVAYTGCRVASRLTAFSAASKAISHFTRNLPAALCRDSSRPLWPGKFKAQVSSLLPFVRFRIHRITNTLALQPQHHHCPALIPPDLIVAIIAMEDAAVTSSLGNHPNTMSWRTWDCIQYVGPWTNFPSSHYRISVSPPSKKESTNTTTKSTTASQPFPAKFQAVNTNTDTTIPHRLHIPNTIKVRTTTTRHPSTNPLQSRINTNTCPIRTPTEPATTTQRQCRATMPNRITTMAANQIHTTRKSVELKV